MRLLSLCLIAHAIFESQPLPLSTRIAENVINHGPESVEEVSALGIPNKPRNFYPETVKLFLSGNPRISHTRSPETRSAYLAWKQTCSRDGRCKHMYEKLGWPEHMEVPAPLFLDKKPLQDERIAKWAKNDFPYHTPPGVDHRVFWARVNLVNKESFRPRQGESWPSEDYKDPKRISALLEYIDTNAFFGYVGHHDVDHDSSLNIGEHLHPGKKPWKASNGETITQEEGWQAFKWASRHFNAYLKEVLSSRYEEMVWIRSPHREKSIMMEHVHVMGLLKKEIHSEDKAAASEKHTEDHIYQQT
ncbi:secreted protein [Melampsora americana]|nr:secreted protein [Melampsora americana]